MAKGGFINSVELQNIKTDLKKLANIQKAQILQKFFKTGKGEYGEGDVFIGVTVPQARQISQKFKDLSLPEIRVLLKSKIHEERLTGLLILVHKFQCGNDKSREQIYNFYINSSKLINNWDLVDLSAPQIIGGYLLDKNTGILNKLSKSKSLWERRIAVISTYAFIKNGQFEKTLEISKLLLNDKHDLIHKAVGWMLREIGKKDRRTEEAFLQKHYKIMSRTTLRYAIERFPQDLRQKYLRS